ncbi:DUF4192 domain-containing protein [Tsukamurella sp. 8F]|uniref:DUF4192 domain-containing protein n=1 Tax=unclassified Tsukamurella TaxID=2633480 RepID=UPI0023BA2010|nr:MULTISPECIES: DUF4192 domain-containing protein [unclassified Tsukamurella]MDF0532142.1 DUF4192 domain-containing protein [Tsukamurella sp. 8J]MDF0585183.1 DUF4192 domain-containing protein [Tsukamurella sp. 8F]
MTTTDRPDPYPLPGADPDDPAGLPLVRLSEPGDLLAALPGLIGFYPERSMVLIGYDEVTRWTGPVARFDLVLDGEGGLTSAGHRGIADTVRLCKRYGALRILAAVVDDRVTPPVMERIHDRLLVALMADGDGDWDAELEDLFLVRRIAEGELWVCTHGGRGRLPDPGISPVTLARVVDGGSIHSSRTELAAHFAETGPGIGWAQCIAAERAVRRRRGEGRARRDAASKDATRLRLVLAAVCGESAPTDAEVARLGAALLSLRVRDAVFALAATDAADSAVDLLCDLARRLRGEPRAAAATVVAGICYVRALGTMVGVALECALEADPGYRAAQLLAQALDGGMTPESLFSITELGYEIARELGVDMPPRIPRAGVGGAAPPG